MLGKDREMCRMLVRPEEPAKLLSGGIYVPESRKDFTLDMRSSEDAEGERRMIGSGRRPGFLPSREGKLVVLPLATDVPAEIAPLVVARLALFLRSLMKLSEYLRT